MLRRVPAGARILHEPVPGPVLAVVEAPGEAAAIALVQDGPGGDDPGDRRARGGVVSVWARDRAKGERVARTLEAELTWVNEHGAVAPGPGAAAAAPRRAAPGRVPARRWSAARAACPTTRPSFGPEPPPRASPTAANRTGCASSAATPGPLARAALRISASLLRRGTAGL